ncbi:MAG: recombination protein RecR [Rhodospirillales bacterium]|nr:recombination protein RecR [Rhodospirillales bacterium]MCB9996126.1 recombination protein RecR [Rhodospirillales bacterium]
MREEGPLDSLIKALARLPGLGPRSARRIALHLLTNQDKTMRPLMNALQQTAEQIRPCGTCGNLDLSDPCRICQDPKRIKDSLCVVAGVADLWAIERTGAYKGQYHILGGVLSALDGIGPDELRLHSLLERVRENPPEEIILALSATVDGQATAHYLTDKLEDITDAKISRLAHGVPVGGELDYLDDGTITTALKSRAAL